MSNIETTSITSIHIYPVKSLAGFSVRSAKLEAQGFQYDRQWMIVDASGTFISQRDLAPMALIQTALVDDSLRLSMPLGDSVEVPLKFREDAEQIDVKVWKDHCQAIDEGEEAASMLSRYLEKKVRLVRMAPDFKRRVDQRYAKPEDVVSFADGFPVLVISDESLNELNRKLEYPVPMNRFRPNITIGGAEAFAEDNWSEIAIGEVKLSIVKPCARCLIVTIDQDTGESSLEPLRTLSFFRKQGNQILFGQDAIPLTYGEVRVDDRVTATAKAAAVQ